MLLTAFILLLILMALGLPVMAVLALIGMSLDYLYSPMPLTRVMGEVIWQHSNEYLLLAIPLFILLGEIMLRAGIAARMYAAVGQWISWLPGGLMHTNVGTSALFAATSGSSVATAATIGTVALPEIERHGYNERLFLGSLAAGGTLGILIPPSINMILYGALTDTSVPQLYAAGIIPGIIMAGLFSMAIIVACKWNPRLQGNPVKTDWQRRFSALPDLLIPLVLFIIIVGSIYAGFATPTEAAALGVVAAFILAAANRQLNMPMLARCIEGTLRTTGMTLIIIFVAYYLNFVLASIGFVSVVNQAIAALAWPPLLIMLALIVMYVLMGMFMDTFAVMVLTIPLVTPIVVSLGYDPVWFGILMMILCETALITPPIGMVCFVVQGVRKSGSLSDVFIGITPFLSVLFLMMALLLAFPSIALFLPELLYR